MTDHDDLIGRELPQAVAHGDRRVAVADFADSLDTDRSKLVKYPVKSFAGLCRGAVEVGHLVIEAGMRERRSDHEHFDPFAAAVKVAAQLAGEIAAAEQLVGDDQYPAWPVSGAVAGRLRGRGCRCRSLRMFGRSAHTSLIPTGAATKTSLAGRRSVSDRSRRRLVETAGKPLVPGSSTSRIDPG